jgi:hypothetical protein
MALVRQQRFGGGYGSRQGRGSGVVTDMACHQAQATGPGLRCRRPRAVSRSSWPFRMRPIYRGRSSF